MIDPIRIMFEEGRRQALDLQARASQMTGTEIIDEELNAINDALADWRSEAEVEVIAFGSPVRDGGQVWTLIQPYNAAHYSGRPADLRALWGLAHTKDPAKAKPWVASYGTSGLYMVDEVCTHPHSGSGKLHVWRNAYDNNEYPPQTQGVESRWVDMGLVK